LALSVSFWFKGGEAGYCWVLGGLAAKKGGWVGYIGRQKQCHIKPKEDNTMQITAELDNQHLEKLGVLE
jgi:hypothetical protein